jgi:hypothetical protein
MASESRRKEDTANIILKTIIHMKEYWQVWTIISFLIGSMAWCLNAIKSVNIVPSLEARVTVIETKMHTIEEIQKDVRQIRDVLLRYREK